MGKPVRRFFCVQKDVVKRDALDRGTPKFCQLGSAAVTAERTRGLQFSSSEALRFS